MNANQMRFTETEVSILRELAYYGYVGKSASSLSTAEKIRKIEHRDNVTLITEAPSKWSKATLQYHLTPAGVAWLVGLGFETTVKTEQPRDERDYYPEYDNNEYPFDFQVHQTSGEKAAAAYIKAEYPEYAAFVSQIDTWLNQIRAARKADLYKAHEEMWQADTEHAEQYILVRLCEAAQAFPDASAEYFNIVIKSRIYDRYDAYMAHIRANGDPLAETFLLS